MDYDTLELNHIALLQHRAKNSGDTLLFKIPVLKGSEPSQEWNSITVAEFAADVDRVSKFLITELNAMAISPHSIISLLYSGTRYQDLVYAIALSRASYVPQMLTCMLTHPDVIFDLMEKAGSKMILYDPSLEHLIPNCTFPKLSMDPIETCSSVEDDSVLPKMEDLPSSSGVCFIFLTSGSTSGRPKIVPLTQKFVSIYYKAQFGVWLGGKHFDTQDMFLARGTVCSVASMIQYLGCLYTRSCIVSPSQLRFSTEELLNMVNVCGLNRVTHYGSFLAPHIEAAKKDPAILKLMQGLRTVSYGGVPISIADDDWCFQNDIFIMDMYATTECGLLMISVPRKPSRYIRPLPDISCRWDPVVSTLVDNPTSTQLFEFVLLANSPQIPQPHLLGTDGNFHTGDLFEKFSDGSYLFRGRNDDWIKNNYADRCDAKAIEEKIYETCGDLIKNCIVVGHLRPSPALFVECNTSTISEDNLKDSILQRIEDFNAHQYVHERITDKRLIFIVEEGTLPRTMKGNLRRRAIEEKYLKELDGLYMSVYNY